jgi:hypothetical protein
MISDQDQAEFPEDLSFGDLVSWFVSHRSGGRGQRNAKKEPHGMSTDQPRCIRDRTLFLRFSLSRHRSFLSEKSAPPVSTEKHPVS